MKKIFLVVFTFFVCSLAFCGTPVGSFQYNVRTSQSFTAAQINASISKGDYEGYRLQNQKTTLSFDNGFDIVLLSAIEAEHLGLISNASSYPQAFPTTFHMPVFHMSANGKVGAGYSVYDKKYSSNTRN